MNLPNKLTVFRIILILPIILLLIPIGSGDYAQFVQGNTARVLAIVLFCIASFTDFIDGKIARKYNLVTDFGKLVDPIADKLLVIGLFIALSQLGRIHALIVTVILAREFLVTGIRQIAATKGEVIAAGIFGKWKAFFQMLTIIYLLLEPLIYKSVLQSHSNPYLFGDILIIFSVIMTIASGLDYLLKYKNKILDER